MATAETVLLFNLAHQERQLVRQLLSSFEVEMVSLTMQTVRSFVSEGPRRKICLVVVRLDEAAKKQKRILALIRDFVGPLAPILVLVPEKRQKDIKRYIEAGADDFINLPLHPGRFSISFLILLEMGQIIANRPIAPARDLKAGGWSRFLNYFQEGLSYFAPKSLLPKTHSELIFDRWQQLEKLGQGGFGSAWLVKELASGRLAVAKIGHSPEMNIRVLRSAAIQKRLGPHRGIAHLLEVVKDRGRFILIEEYVDGKSLNELLGASLAAQRREDLFNQLLAAVSHAHHLKILHRDIKPENILVTSHNQLKLLDFGIARDLSWQSGRGSSEGTLNFMPPEQFAGQSSLASDVWALGVILYIFATNNVPYFQDNHIYPTNIKELIASRPPRSFNPEIPKSLEQIIVRCLKADPRKRYGDAGQLMDALHRQLPDFGSGTILSEFSRPR